MTSLEEPIRSRLIEAFKSHLIGPLLPKARPKAESDDPLVEGGEQEDNYDAEF